MRQGTRKGLLTMAAAGGLLAMSGGTASADTGAQGDSAHSPGVLSGNTFHAPVNVTVNICGNTVSVLGLLNPAAGNGCPGGAGPSGGGSGSPAGEHGGNGSAHQQPGGSGHGGGDRPQGGRGDQVTGGGSGGHGAHAGGSAHDSPGVGSGNDVQVPVDVPVNVCGNTVDVVGILDPAHGNGCASPEAPGPVEPGHPDEPEKPGEPEHPSEPQQPEHPGKPEEPNRPQTPEEPTSPDTPQTPDQPGSTGEVHAASRPEPVPSAPASAAPEAAGTGGELAHTGAGSQLGVAAPLSAGLLVGGCVLYRRSRAAARR